MLGSIEYAVEHLHVPLIVVLGHENCGAVAAALTRVDFPGNLGKLIKEVHVGRDLPMERAAALPLAIKNNVIYQASQLTQRSKPLRTADHAAKDQDRQRSLSIVVRESRVGGREVSRGAEATIFIVAEKRRTPLCP